MNHFYSTHIPNSRMNSYWSTITPLFSCLFDVKEKAIFPTLCHAAAPLHQTDASLAILFPSMSFVTEEMNLFGSFLPNFVLLSGNFATFLYIFF